MGKSMSKFDVDFDNLGGHMELDRRSTGPYSQLWEFERVAVDIRSWKISEEKTLLWRDTSAHPLSRRTVPFS
jgi:hypothetical protein